MIYDGEGQFTTPRSWRKKADDLFVIGMAYIMETIEQRSAKQHARYFALVNEYWATLPEAMAGQYPSSEHLRKAALCHTGYCKEATTVCANNQESQRLVALVGEMDSYAVASLSGNVVKVWRAETQNTKAMDAKRFKASSDAVLLWIEENCLGMHGEKVA